MGIRNRDLVALCITLLLLVSCGNRADEVAAPGVTSGAPDSSALYPAGLRIVVPDGRLDMTEPGIIEIYLEDAANLYGLHLSLRFDPEKIRVEDINPVRDGVQISPGSLPAPDFTVVNRVDNDHGVVEYAVTQLHPREPARGDGLVAVIHLRGVDTGVTPLKFSYIKLVSPEGREIPVRVVDHTLEVSRPET